MAKRKRQSKSNTHQPQKVAEAGTTAQANRRHWRSVILVALILVLLKVALSFQFESPWFEPDETTYALRGWHLAEGDGLSWRHPGRGAGSDGYVVLLAGCWLLTDDTDTFIRLALLANCLLSGMLLVVGYAMLRHWCEHWASVLGALTMVIFAPVFVYSFAMLSETLFFLLVAISVVLAQQVFRNNRWYWWIGLGAVAAMASITRVNGQVLTVAVILLTVMSITQRRNLRTIAGSVAGIITMIGLQMLARRLSRPTTVVQIEGGDGDYTLVQQLFLIFGDIPGHIAGIGQSTVLAVAYVILSGLAILPVAFVLFSALNLRRQQGGKRQFDLPLIYCMLLIAGMLAMHVLALSRGAEVELKDRIGGRYVDVAVMLIVGLGMAWLWSRTNNMLRRPQTLQASGASPILSGRRSAVIIVAVSAALGLLAWIVFPLGIAPETLQEQPTPGAQFSANLGLAPLLVRPGQVASESAGLRLVFAASVVLALAAVMLLRKRPRIGAVATLAAIGLVSAVSIQQVSEFTQPFSLFHDFARTSAAKLEARFPGHKVVYVDRVAAEHVSMNAIRMFATGSLELWNPQAQFIEVGMERHVPPGSIVFSMYQLPFETVHQQHNLRLYYVLE